VLTIAMTQPPVPQPPASPPAPRAAAAPTAAGTETVVSPPGNADELAALRAREREVRNQLDRATDERENLAETLRPDEGPAPPPAVSSGIEARIAVIDDRILRLERERDGIDRAMSQAPASLVAQDVRAETGVATSIYREAREEGMGQGVAIGMPLGMVLALLVAWVRRQRAARRSPRPGVDSGRSQEQLVAAVEAMAVEVERIGEAQRFMTQLMLDRGEAPHVTPRGDAPREAAWSERRSGGTPS
jgi:hypothetical protein